MTEERARLYVDAIRATNTMVMNIICPPGRFALLIVALVVAVPGLVWLFWLTS